MINSNIVDLKPNKKTGKIIAIIVAVIIVLIGILTTLAIVPAGSTGVIVTFGKVSKNTLSEGLHLKVPFAQELVVISNKIQVYEADASAVSKDLQTVNSKIAVNFRVRNDASASIYKNIGPDYQTVILMPAVQESMKAVSAKYTAEQLITERNKVGNEIKDQLEAKVADYGIQIEKFNIVNFDFSMEFNNAIEAKQVAEQNLLKTKTEQQQAIVVAEAEAKKKVIAAEADAKAIQTKADAQAKANKELAQSLNDKLINYQAIEKWDGILPKVASSANPLVSLDLNDSKTETN
ncbi:MAG: prohibitin family protein [Ruminococcus sp.]|nr:prohibitin family protein [Ruminococcus sp.]